MSTRAIAAVITTAVLLADAVTAKAQDGNAGAGAARDASDAIGELAYVLSSSDCDDEEALNARAEAARKWWHWGRKRPCNDLFIVTFDAVTQTFKRRVQYTYPNALVILCIANIDYRYRYRLPQAAATDLPPPAHDYSGAFSLLATTGKPADTSKTLSAQINQAPPAPGEKPATRLEAKLKRLSDLTDDVMKKIQSIDTDELDPIKQSISDVADAAKELNGNAPVLQHSVNRLAQAMSAATKTLKDRVSLESEALALAAEAEKTLAEIQRELKKLGTDVKSEKQAAQSNLDQEIGMKRANSKHSTTNAEDYRARVTDLEKQTSALQSTVTRVGIEVDKLNSLEKDATQALFLAREMLNHFEADAHNVHFVAVDANKEYELNLKLDRVRVEFNPAESSLPQSGNKDGANPAPAGGNADDGGAGDTPPPSPRADDKKGSKNGDNGKGDDNTNDDSKGPFHFQEVTGVDLRQKFQVRSFTYFRVNVGLVFTSLRDPGYTLAYNDVGAQVITTGNDPGITPMFLLSHYWCGVDLRELQPYHRFKQCGVYNTFFPTFTLGVPLSRNPLQNLFIGAMWQPVPGFAFTVGAHLGEVRVLKHGYVAGQPPPLVQGGIFNVADAQEDRLRLGYYLGFAITDSIFISFINKIAGITSN